MKKIGYNEKLKAEVIKVDYLQARDYIANGNSGKIVLGLDRVRKLCEFWAISGQSKTNTLFMAINGKRLQ